MYQSEDIGTRAKKKIQKHTWEKKQKCCSSEKNKKVLE